MSYNYITIIKKEISMWRKNKNIVSYILVITSISTYDFILNSFLYDISQVYKRNLSYIIYECIFSSIYIFTINDY